MAAASAVRTRTKACLPGRSEPAQTKIFDGIAKACVAEAKCRALVFFGDYDPVSWWRNEIGCFGDDPLLRDDHYAPKPSYIGVRAALSGH